MPKRPRLLVSVNAKIPTALRQNYLDSFIDEYLKFCAAEEAYKKVNMVLILVLILSHKIKLLHCQCMNLICVRLVCNLYSYTVNPHLCRLQYYLN